MEPAGLQGDLGEVASLSVAPQVVLRYRRWAPAEPKAQVVLFSGVMSHSAWFFPLAPPLVAAGVELIGADRRGSGLNEAGRGDAASAATLVSDALAIVEANRRPNLPLYLVGWCWGAVLALNVLEKLAPPAGLVLVAPGLFPSAEVEARAAAADALAGAEEDVASIPTPIAEEMFTSGPWLDAFVRVDPLRLRTMTPRFRKVMTRLAFGAHLRLKKLTLPVLAILAEDDPATDNSAVRRALAHLADLRVHELVGGHGLQFDAADAVTSLLLGFLRETGGADVRQA